MTAPELKPCPFCGGVMENRGYGAMHLGTAVCPISGYAFDPEAWNLRADLPPTDAEVMNHPKVQALVDAAGELSSIVEGIQGAFNHGTWRDEKNGMRLKDTSEWVTFYVALAAIQEAKP